jgi:hypothetical protein
MVRINPFSSITMPVPSRSAPSVSTVRASGMALILSLTMASNGSDSSVATGSGAWVARQVDKAALKKDADIGSSVAKTRPMRPFHALVTLVRITVLVVPPNFII